MGYLSESGLTTLWAKLKATFATITHSHGDATTSASGMMSSEDKTKLNGIASGAEVNVQADWSVTDTSSDAYIANKPTIPTVPTDVSAFNNDAGYLTSHQSIKTINNTSLVGTGNVSVGITKTVRSVSIATSAWSSKTANVTVSGVTTSNDVIVSPVAASYSVY